MIAIKNKCAVAPTKVFTLSEVISHVIKNLTDNPEGVSRHIDYTVERLWKKGSGVHAIIILRLFYPMGIKEAREYCEAEYGPNPSLLG